MEKQDRELLVWFDVPVECEGELSLSGNPWLVLMAPLAMHCHEDIHLPFGVDSHLLENVSAMMRFWAHHHPHLRPAEIHAPILAMMPATGSKSGLYFSGGVDSTFSLLRHCERAEGCGSTKVDDLIFIAGLDIPITRTAEINLASACLGNVAASHGKKLIQISTNLRQPGTAYVGGWITSYGCALGAVGHLLEGRYRELIISAAHEYADSSITGSHPITDPLLSSRHLRYVHDGAAFNRLEKTQRIAEAGKAVDALRVCWEGMQHNNCSNCRKCLLTMAALDLAGFRNRVECFDWACYSPEKLGLQFLDNDVQLFFFQEVLADATRRGRADIVEALSHAIRSSLTTRQFVALIRRIPLLWRFDYQVQQTLIRRAMRRFSRSRAQLAPATKQSS